MPKETTATPTAPDLAAENVTLKAKIAQFEAAKKQADADEVLIAEKMAKGLRREQAAAVIKRQREFETRKAQAATTKK